MLDKKKHYELSGYYSSFSGINFDTEVLFELCIYDARVISKPGKIKRVLSYHINKALDNSGLSSSDRKKSCKLKMDLKKASDKKILKIEKSVKSNKRRGISKGKI